MIPIIPFKKLPTAFNIETSVLLFASAGWEFLALSSLALLSVDSLLNPAGAFPPSNILAFPAGLLLLSVLLLVAGVFPVILLFGKYGLAGGK